MASNNMTFCGSQYSPLFHWQSSPGSVSSAQCSCSPGWSGSNCEISRCADALPFLSLGGLLLQSDSQAKLFPPLFNTTVDQYASAKYYITNLISVEVDTNGDGNVTVAEMTAALAYRSINSIPTSIRLWCRSAASLYCYGDQNPYMIEVSSII